MDNATEDNWDFYVQNFAAVSAKWWELLDNGTAEVVLILMNLRSDQARRLAEAFVGVEEVAKLMERAETEKPPSAVWGGDRQDAIKLVESLFPGDYLPGWLKYLKLRLSQALPDAKHMQVTISRDLSISFPDWPHSQA